MKKLFILITAFVLLIASQAWADWTLRLSSVSESQHYIKWKVVCTSDGSALSATNLLALPGARLLRIGQGETLMFMKVSPGTGSIIPNTTINITLSDAEQDALWTETAIAEDAVSWHDMSDDLPNYIPVLGALYLTLSDIGTAGDQVTLYFISWRE